MVMDSKWVEIQPDTLVAEVIFWKLISETRGWHEQEIIQRAIPTRGLAEISSTSENENYTYKKYATYLSQVLFP